jgi:transcriptional regulator with XRE-family HTH domain
MKMDFAMLIRGYREQAGLSQDALAQQLSELMPHKPSIDVGTISRWERQASVPSLRNQLYILRKLAIPVVTRRFQPEGASEVAKQLLRKRFNRFCGLGDVPYRQAKPQFQLQESACIDDFLNDTTMLQASHLMRPSGIAVDELRGLLKQLNDLKVYLLRFYQGSQLVSHLAYAVANTEEIQRLLEAYHQIKLDDFFAAEPKGRSLVNFSAYLSDLALYMFCAQRLVSTIEADHSIDWCLSYSSINEDWQVYKQLGAKVLLRGNPKDSGGIRIGKGRFSAVLCGVDSNSILASPITAIAEQSIASLADIEVI